MVREVVAPWKRGEKVMLRKYDFRHDRLLPAEEVPDVRVLILEGSYCNLPEIRQYADLRFFVTASRDIRDSAMGRYAGRLSMVSFSGDDISLVSMSRDNPLAAKEKITFDDLKPLIEIVHGDPYVPSLPVSVVRRAELPDEDRRRIFLFERGGQFDLLVENPETFMWVSPIPQKLLDRYGLVQRVCVDNNKLYRDVLIRRTDYAMTELDRRFLAELIESKRKWLQ